MATALTIGPTAVPSATLATANALTANAGTPSATSVATTIGQATGFGELYSQGTTQAWPGLFTIPDPTGHGWVWDSTALAGQQLLGGVWSGNISWATSVGYIVADVYLRWSLYNTETGVYKTLGTLVAPQQTINTTFPLLPITGLLPQVTCGVGDTLFLDAWVNITSNGTGSNTAVLYVGGVSSTLVIDQAYTTQGFQPTPLPQRATTYSYGDFCFNDGAAYLLTQKTLDVVPAKQTLFKIARFEGMKQTGVVVNERTIPLSIRVVGASRADLEAKIDALTLAFLGTTQQPLTLHSLDGRYFVADCVSLSAPLPPGAILSTLAQASFLCQQPYAFAAAASSYALTNQLLQASSVAGQWTTAMLSLTGGGTVFSRPVLTIQNAMTHNAPTLTSALTNGSPYTTLAISPLGNATVVGDTYTLNDGAGHTQNVVVSALANAGATTLTVTSFTANFSYPATTTTVTKITTITSVTVTQITDGQTLTVASLTMATGDILTIACDPTAANGYTATVNGGAPLAFSGVFPIQEAGATLWQVTVACASAAVVTLDIVWTPRFLV